VCQSQWLITDIWTKFGTKHKYYTINTLEWPNSHNQSKMAAAAILNFGKMSITPDWIKIYAPNLWEDATRPCGDDHVTKSQNRKLIRLTSSNEWRISASISVTITCIWTKFGTKFKYHTINTPEWSNSHNLKIQDGSRCHLGFLGYV